MNSISDKRSELKKVFSHLPILDNKQKDVDIIIDDLLRLASIAKVNDSKGAQKCGRNQAKKELETFFALARKLYVHINSMHKTTNDLFDGKNPPHPHLIKADLRTLLTRRANVMEKAEAVPNLKKPKPHKRQARVITNFLGKKYELLTGKKPTRITTKERRQAGPFFNLVKSVFVVLDMEDVSAASQIQK